MFYVNLAYKMQNHHIFIISTHIDKLDELLPSQFIESLDIDDIKFDSKKIIFLKELININHDKKIGIILSDEMDNLITEKFTKLIIEKGKGENINIIRGIEKFNSFELERQSITEDPYVVNQFK